MHFKVPIFDRSLYHGDTHEVPCNPGPVDFIFEDAPSVSSPTPTSLADDRPKRSSSSLNPSPVTLMLLVEESLTRKLFLPLLLCRQGRKKKKKPTIKQLRKSKVTLPSNQSIAVKLTNSLGSLQRGWKFLREFSQGFPISGLVYEACAKIRDATEDWDSIKSTAQPLCMERLKASASPPLTAFSKTG